MSRVYTAAGPLLAVLVTMPTTAAAAQLLYVHTDRATFALRAMLVLVPLIVGLTLYISYVKPLIGRPHHRSTIKVLRLLRTVFLGSPRPALASSETGSEVTPTPAPSLRVPVAQLVLVAALTALVAVCFVATWPAGAAGEVWSWPRTTTALTLGVVLVLLAPPLLLHIRRVAAAYVDTTSRGPGAPHLTRYRSHAAVTRSFLITITPIAGVVLLYALGVSFGSIAWLIGLLIAVSLLLLLRNS